MSTEKKKVTIKARPTRQSAASATPGGDTWVSQGAETPNKEPIKRLTIDIPASLHAELKAHCAHEDTTIARLVRGLLDEVVKS